MEVAGTAVVAVLVVRVFLQVHMRCLQVAGAAQFHYSCTSTSVQMQQEQLDHLYGSVSISLEARTKN